MDLYTIAGIGVVVLTIGIIVWSIVKLATTSTDSKKVSDVSSVALSMQDPVLAASSMAMNAADDPDDDLDVSTSDVMRSLKDEINIDKEPELFPVLGETAELVKLVDNPDLVDTGTVIVTRPKDV